MLSPAAATPSANLTAHPGDPAVYGTALRDLQAYLDEWREKDKREADEKWLLPGNQDGASVAPSFRFGLVEGVVLSYRPWSWESANDFELETRIEMRFSDPTYWPNGDFTKFVIFSRKPGQDHFRMALGTGP